MAFYKSSFNLLLIALAVAFSLRAKADPNAGKTKSVTCAACHGTEGVSANDVWPNLAGQKSGYLTEQLKAFRSGERANPVMSGIAKMLSDQDIQDLSEYYSAKKAQP